MKQIVFATNNAHKLKEVREILGDTGIVVLSLEEIGCNDDIPETADTLDGNALIKAQWVKQHYGYDCFADDTGLEVDALGGAPGVYSARYAGPGHDSAANVALLLGNMEGMEDRKARFRTVIALIIGNGEPVLFNGIVEGCITHERHGESGFGYDPVFRPEGEMRTFAQMSDGEKNAISHRGRAVKKLVEYLSQR
ncbi:non-canonical purine NTP diphosphatase [Muribaculum sp.]|uniref:non-canonical purine NTP diphosphatase n=1 Tax=Muribaculum sp. TaxID=1918611 RepID=UPI0023D45B70|nr:non-canonical purine NTP diphosphatase [Muribaculum sp.]MDE5706429.1 non-canonical purine NTP diphosphatase [Muribaculum sp.]